MGSCLALASKACSELVRCNYKSERGCGAKCGCKKINWNCTDLCSCNCEKAHSTYHFILSSLFTVIHKL